MIDSTPVEASLLRLRRLSMLDIPKSQSGKDVSEVAVPLMQKTGELLLKRFDEEKNIREKGRANIVTDVDYEAEQLILATLRREYPNYGVLAEESGKAGEGDSPYVWIVDPVDGTRNYALGVPYFSTTIALAHAGKVIYGITYDPCRNELFEGRRGAGATMNGHSLRVSERSSLSMATIATDMGYNDAMAGFALQLLDRLWPGMQAIRIMGSAALGLAYAAAGRTDVYFHHSLAPWDIAAGVVIAEEAGAVVTDRSGAPISIDSPSIIVANDALKEEFLQATTGLAWREAELTPND